MPQWGMYIDLDRCAACQACTVACKYENNGPIGVFRNEVLSINTGRNVNNGADGKTNPSVRLEFIPRPCMHCDNPGCTKVCPVKATYRRDSDGIVVQDMTKCIGCRACMTACPYGARYFQKKIAPYDDRGLPYYNPDAPAPVWQTVAKCTFCMHKVDKGVHIPACVQICASGARKFGDISDPNSEISQLIHRRKAYVLRPDKKTKPKVYYAKEG